MVAKSVIFSLFLLSGVRIVRVERANERFGDGWLGVGHIYNICSENQCSSMSYTSSDGCFGGGETVLCFYCQFFCTRLGFFLFALLVSFQTARVYIVVEEEGWLWGGLSLLRVPIRGCSHRRYGRAITSTADKPYKNYQTRCPPNQG